MSQHGRSLGANLTGATLHEAQLDHVHGAYALFRDAYMAWINLDGSDLFHADFQRSNLTSANLNNTRLEGADLIRTYLNKANLETIYAAQANFSGAFPCECKPEGCGSFICNSAEYPLKRGQSTGNISERGNLDGWKNL
jgi:uncharacterized protein YjbI with pentapeptide repeats